MMTDDTSGDGKPHDSGTPWGHAMSFSGNPAEQITQSLKAVNEALKSAGERVASNSQEVGLCAIRQAEENSRQLFDTLRAMAATSNPREVGELYTRFVSDSAKSHAAQLREMGEILARTSRDAWAPVTDALAKTQTPG